MDDSPTAFLTPDLLQHRINMLKVEFTELDTKRRREIQKLKEDYNTRLLYLESHLSVMIPIMRIMRKLTGADNDR